MRLYFEIGKNVVRGDNDKVERGKDEMFSRLKIAAKIKKYTLFGFGFESGMVYAVGLTGVGVFR